MVTKNFKIKNISQEDKKFIHEFQKGYSIAFRKMYMHIEEIADPLFKKNIITKYLFSEKLYEYTTKEVISFYEKNTANKKNIKQRIENNETKLSKEKNNKKQKELNKKIAYLKNSYKKGVCFGGKQLLRTITEQKNRLSLLKGQENDNLQIIINKNKEKFHNNRILSPIMYGDATRNGNRFFHLNKLSEGIIIFKLENVNKKLLLEIIIKNKSERELLFNLQQAAMNKEFPITMRISTEYVWFTYEDGMFSKNYFREKEFNKKYKEINDKEQRKQLYKTEICEHEQRMFSDKIIKRYCAIDQNPTGIGYVIADKVENDKEGQMNIIKKGFFDLSKLSKNSVSADKRKYELSIVVKTLFNEMKHYKVSHFIIEDLATLKNSNNGSREGNRLNNNVWSRNFTMQIVKRKCMEQGIKMIEINPCYSSFIGNLINKEYDPVAAAIEICRRGMIKYLKGGSFYAKFHKEQIITEVCKRTEMDYDLFASVNNWVVLWKIISGAKKSVRLSKVSDFGHSAHYMKSNKSLVKKLAFHHISI